MFKQDFSLYATSGNERPSDEDTFEPKAIWVISYCTSYVFFWAICYMTIITPRTLNVDFTLKASGAPLFCWCLHLLSPPWVACHRHRLFMVAIKAHYASIALLSHKHNKKGAAVWRGDKKDSYYPECWSCVFPWICWVAETCSIWMNKNRNRCFHTFAISASDLTVL